MKRNLGRVVLLEDFSFNGVDYKKGHQFNVIGDDNMRGPDLQDDDGNTIYETRFMPKYEYIDRVSCPKRTIACNRGYHVPKGQLHATVDVNPINYTHFLNIQSSLAGQVSNLSRFA